MNEALRLWRDRVHLHSAALGHYLSTEQYHERAPTPGTDDDERQEADESS